MSAVAVMMMAVNDGVSESVNELTAAESTVTEKAKKSAIFFTVFGLRSRDLLVVVIVVVVVVVVAIRSSATVASSSTSSAAATAASARSVVIIAASALDSYAQAFSVS